MMARRLAREEGLLLGGSAGLNVALAVDLARELNDPDALIVTILCDTGERYLSKQFNDAWMQENQMLETPRTTVQELLERRPAERAGGRERGAGGGGAAGAHPDEHLGREPDPGAGERAVGRRPDRGDPDDPGPGPAGAARPAGQRGDGSAVPRGRGRRPPTDRVGAMLTRENPAALVRREGKLVGIVSRYDVLQQLIGTR